VDELAKQRDSRFSIPALQTASEIRMRAAKVIIEKEESAMRLS
jgi:hypothetical protein